MIEGETDIGNQSLGIHRAANDGIRTKILFIFYGMKGNDASLCIKSFKSGCSVKCLDRLHCTILHLIDMSLLHLVSLHFIYRHFKCHVMSCDVKCSEVN